MAVYMCTTLFFCVYSSVILLVCHQIKFASLQHTFSSLAYALSFAPWRDRYGLSGLAFSRLMPSLPLVIHCYMHVGHAWSDTIGMYAVDFMRTELYP